MLSKDELDDALAEFASLRRRVDGLANDVTGLKNQDDEFGRVLGALAEQISAIAELLSAKDPAFLPSPWWWPRLNRPEAEEAWAKLTAFVDNILIPIYDNGYTDLAEGRLRTGDNIKECWFAHPDAVQRLADLYWAWLGDYKRNAPITGPLEWGQTWIDGTLQAVKARPECLGGCKRYEAVTEEAKKNGEMRWPDRVRFIANDVKGRPEPESKS